MEIIYERTVYERGVIVTATLEYRLPDEEAAYRIIGNAFLDPRFPSQMEFVIREAAQHEGVAPFIPKLIEFFDEYFSPLRYLGLVRRQAVWLQSSGGMRAIRFSFWFGRVPARAQRDRNSTVSV